MARTCKWTGVTSNAWDTATNWDTDDTPDDGDSVTFYGVDLGAGTKCAVGPAAPITLVAITADAAYGTGAVCYENVTVGTLTMNGQGQYAVTGGTITAAVVVAGTGPSGLKSNAALDLSGAALSVGAGSELDIEKGAGALTTTATTTYDIAGAAGIIYVLNADLVGVVNATAAGTYSLEDSTITGKVNCASAVAWSATGTCGITLNATNATTRFGGTVPVDLPIEINGAGITVTAAAAFTVASTFTVTAGTFAAGAYSHAFAGDFVYTGDSVTGTGIWTLSGTSAFNLTGTGIYLTVASGTETLADTTSVAAIWLAAGATLDGDSQDLVLNATSGRITGYGTVANLIPTGDDVHCGPDIIDGTGNDAKVVFDNPRTSTALVEL